MKQPPRPTAIALAVWDTFGRFLQRVYLWRGSRADTVAALELVDQVQRSRAGTFGGGE